MKINAINLFVGIILLCAVQQACTPANEFYKRVKDKNYYRTCATPSGVKIANDFYYDQGEVTNTDWLEYLYWTGRVYGSQSKEYKATLPDTLVWIDSTALNIHGSCLRSYVTYYMRHPAYQPYPVVGISQQQAIAFSKWRSDRVMEFLLVANKQIKWDPNPTAATQFTIEKYYAGKYKNIKPNLRFIYYPDFRLPTVDEWEKAVTYDDLMAVDEPRDTKTELWLDVMPCRDDTLFCDPTEKTTDSVSPPKNALIYNLRDNVREWTSEDSICVGGGWHDKKDIVLKQDTFHVKKPNAWTGFRDVCEWKKWDK